MLRAAGKFFLKKKAKKGVFRYFLENFDKKNCVFSVRPRLSKLASFGAQGDLEEILGTVSQKWISQNSSKGDPLGQQGFESLKIPPKSVGAFRCFDERILLSFVEFFCNAHA